MSFFRGKNMEDGWLLSTPMSLNANRPTLETKERKTQRELFIVIDEMTLEHIGKKLEQQNKDSSNKTSQPEACLTATLDEFENYNHKQSQHIPEKKK